MRIKFFLIIILIILLAFSAMSTAGVFDKEEYKARRVKLMQSISDGIAIILGAEIAQPFTEFYQNNDFFYFAGVDDPNAILIIDGMKKESILFLASNQREESFSGPWMKPGKEAVEKTGIKKIFPASQFTRILSSYQAQTDVIYTPFQPQERMSNCGSNNITYFMERLLDPWDSRVSREMNFIKKTEERFPAFTFKDLSPFIAQMRVIKSPAEIEIMREASRISSLAHIELLKAAEPGMYEWQLDVLFQFMVMKEGAQGLAYHAIVASGPQSNAHGAYNKNFRKLEDGDMVKLDAGCDYLHYDADITISFPVNGKFTQKQREIYNVCFAIEEACFAVYRPGITGDEARKEVLKILNDKGISLNSSGVRLIWANHWIGLAVHDDGPPERQTVLKPGMITTFEPMVVFDKENVGVRIEDTVLITEDGCENLSRLIPRKPAEIEKTMAETSIYEMLKQRKK